MNKAKMYITQIITEKLAVVYLFILVVSCQTNQKFDAKKWQQKGIDWEITDTRENMVDDLLLSDTLNGMTRKEVIHLLGFPESENMNEMIYLIREKYDTDIDPTYISNLHVSLSDSGYVSTCTIK